VENAEQPKKKGAGAKIVALCLVCALVGGLAGGAGVATLGGKSGSAAASGTITLQTDRVNTPVSVASVTGSQELTIPEIYAANVDSAVGITVNTLVGTNIFGQQVTSAASGSGFVLTSDGYIVTNHHVIENATSIKVSFSDGTVYDGTLVGSDADNDIAVVKIDATDLKPVVIGNSDTLNVGETVVAIGNPLGELTFSQTSGTVSALNRQITMSDGTVMNLLQTDCPINSGNSGGPLFNIYGEVIGIVNAKYSSSSSGTSVDNIGFAIPISNVYDMLQEIIEVGYVSKPYLGITVRTITSDLQQYNLPAGAGVESVVEGSCADKAGLKAGDVITAVNGQEITTKDELISSKESLRVGDTMTLTVSRNGETLTISVVLEAEPAETQTETDTQTQTQTQQQATQPYGGSGGSSYNPYSWYGWSGMNG
jgi:serine protease Do